MKKFLSLALALIMVLSLVACGDTASDNTDNSNTDANTEQTGEIKGLTAEERAKEFITVGTGPTSGIYFPIGGAFATALKEYGYQTSAEATNATGQNIQNILTATPRSLSPCRTPSCRPTPAPAPMRARARPATCAR